MVGRSHPYELRVLDDLGTPITAAVVDIGGAQAGTTGANGTVDLVWTPANQVLQVSAPGHVPRTMTIGDAPDDSVELVLKAQVLRGRVVDTEGDGIEGAKVVAGPGEAMTNAQGEYEIRGAGVGTVSVARAAWTATTFEWDGGTAESVVPMEPFTARAVHIGGEEARDEIDRFVDMAMETELNALMIDLKDESGMVFYNTQNAIAVEAGAVSSETFDLSATADRAEDLGLYLIGRIVLFNDPVAATQLPEMAVWDSDTNTPYEANGQHFLDPTDPDARKYGLDLAVEACRRGVDEIQFDYVRFPDARRDSATFDGGVDPEVRVSTVSGFLTEAVNVLRPMGCAVAADIFGYLTTATDDGGIGQRWEEVAGIVDVISPMLYPSHYDANWYEFADPDDFPGEMIDLALADGISRLTKEVVIRPWLQDFGYGPEEVRAQITAAEQYGLGWMLWNASSEVTVDALLPAE
jgi:hypothetical protein